jgi:ASPIC and UnbV/FG-GAP-like repeat
MKVKCSSGIHIGFVLLSLVLVNCTGKKGSFVKLSPSTTGIAFTNTIYESDSVNIFDFANIYNGGGAGVGDFNNDGLQDLYFTGNMVANKLYMNRGGMKFEDVTAASGTAGESRWNRGTAIVDINNDGKMDIYVCATAMANPGQRINMLYVNRGNDKSNTPVFKDMAHEYGIADTTQSTMAYFFDYDNDGDLDMYIGVNHIIKDEYANVFKKRNLNGEHPSTSKLYRNDWNDTLQHPYYTDVSRQAGILIEGYTHAVNIFDANRDGWMDILETNDYISNNVLYINNHDGTFTDHIADYFKHASANSMGSDAVDINNDGLTDVIEVDMAPQDNLRKKMFQSPGSYQTYQNSDLWGYQYQYVRNMIQVNQGPTIGQQDSIQHPVFADLGYLCGIAETDWSWTPLAADFDNDGNKDIIFTNGFPKDITDRDFMTYRQNAKLLTAEKDMLAEIPAVKIHNYAYKNNGNFSFTDQTKEWGFEEPTFSNGAAYADLDNDGDLDVIINNINDPAMIYENRVCSEEDKKSHYLRIAFAGSEKNRNGIGAEAELFYKGKRQVMNNMPFRGYISTVQYGVHFGLGTETIIDSVCIRWPDGKQQLLKAVKADQVLTVHYKDAAVSPALPALFATNTLLTNITGASGAGVLHREDDFIDFNTQKLLPHKLSDFGPPLAAGDLNNDGLQDMIMGGSLGYSAIEMLQQPDGKFKVKELMPGASRTSKPWHDMGMLLFDADKDGDQDLYIACGGYEAPANDNSYTDKFYLNDGKGNFKPDTSAMPRNTNSKSCVRAVDYDKDGDLDLFVAGRCVPWMYPQPLSSSLYRNDSKEGRVIFTDITAADAKGLVNTGMVCDALFSDFDNDGWVDLIVAGEFMPIRFFRNNKGKFELLQTALDNETGWWNSLTAGDFDNDGDMDYVAGNAGNNAFYRPSAKYPVTAYGKDFDNNGSYDALMSVYLPSSQKDPQPKEYTAHTRDDMIKQMIEIRNKFKTYKDFGTSTFDKFLSAEQLKGAVISKATNFSSSYIRNDGNGRFSMTPLPVEAQVSAVFGMLAQDLDGDGNLDIIVTGNDYGTEVPVGRSDAANGLVLLGNGRGIFRPLSILQSGLYLPGNAKSLVTLFDKNNQCLFAAAQNRGVLQVLNSRYALPVLPAAAEEMYAMVVLKNGRHRKQEFYYGSGYLSQSARFVTVSKSAAAVEFAGTDGKKRNVTLSP